jgi:hypothetical protein
MERSFASRAKRRPLLLLGLLGAIAVPLVVDTAPTSAAPEPSATWQLRWSPEAEKDGLDAFEGLESDRKNSHPGVEHLYVQGNNYRFDMHVRDRDGSDRQRTESKGMRVGGDVLDIDKGQTWRLSHSLYIPASLRATSSFTHIMQLKRPGTCGECAAPIMVMSLRRQGSNPTIELRVISTGTTVARTNLTPLQDRWISSEVEFTADDRPRGRIRWVLRNGSETVVDAQRTNVDLWAGDRVRPKWGIYRSLSDRANLRDCYLLINRMRAHQFV